jgi:hypothetical protein
MQIIHRLRAPRYYFYVKDGRLGRLKNGLLGGIRTLRAQDECSPEHQGREVANVEWTPQDRQRLL